MQYGLVMFGLLFPSGQEPAKAIHPAMSMRPLDDPAMGYFYGRQTPLYGTGYAARSDGSVDTFSASFVTFVQAHAFLPRTPHLEGYWAYLHLFDVMRVCCCNNQQQRKSVGICHQTALYALFLSARGVTAFGGVQGVSLATGPDEDEEYGIHGSTVIHVCAQG